MQEFFSLKDLSFQKLFALFLPVQHLSFKCPIQSVVWKHFKLFVGFHHACCESVFLERCTSENTILKQHLKTSARKFKLGCKWGCIRTVSLSISLKLGNNVKVFELANYKALTWIPLKICGLIQNRSLCLNKGAPTNLTDSHLTIILKLSPMEIRFMCITDLPQSVA